MPGSSVKNVAKVFFKSVRDHEMPTLFTQSYFCFVFVVCACDIESFFNSFKVNLNCYDLKRCLP